ncbi:PfkB family carbohydrate kinase [Cupriavidus basilensis]
MHFGFAEPGAPAAGRAPVRRSHAGSGSGQAHRLRPQFPARPCARPRTRRSLPISPDWRTHIKVSDEDLRGLYPALDEHAALAALGALAPRASVLLTRGADGMTLLHGDEACEQPVFAVDVVDTVGCGDAAMGGWMAGLLLDPGAMPARQARWAAG